MAKIFNIKLFEGWVPDTGEISIDAALFAILGQADTLKFQVNVSEFSGTTPTVLVTYYSSIDNVYFNQEKQQTTGTITTVGRYFFTTDTAGFVNGGFGKVTVKMANGSSKAYIQVFATGRIT
jgi:hypothetical protein